MNEQLLRRLAQLEARLERLERMEPAVVRYASGITANPPRAANLNSRFGDVADKPNGWIGILHATGAGGNRRWICVASGGVWWILELAQAT